MKKTFQIFFTLFLAFAWINVSAQDIISAGKVPSMRLDRTHTVVNVPDNPATIAYGWSSIQTYTLSMPIPAGTPFTLLTAWTAPNFASSMIKGGDGNYYLVEISTGLYNFNPGTGAVTLLGAITGLQGADQINGIAFNPANGNYYLAAGNLSPASDNIYSFNVTTRVATLIGPTGTTGLQIDLGITTAGVCYSYDLITNNAYTINLSTGAATLLGALGYDPNYGQGMSIDNESGVVYLSAFNNASSSGQLRTLNTSTGNTTLVTDWGFDQIAPFALDTQYGPPCPIGAPSNPNPPNGATGLPINGNTATWTNGAGTVNVEVWFGPTGNVVKVYDGVAKTSQTLPTLNYATTYYWYIVCKDATCGTQGPTWTFTTMQDPLLVIDTVNVYPQNANYWTGSTTAAAKTQVSLMKAYAGGEQAWAKFDVTSIPAGATINSVQVNWYITAQNCPYFYINALPIDPVTANAATLFAAITGGVHYYTFQTCPVTGWNTVLLAGNVNADLAASLGSGWFAISFYEYESSTYYFDAQGWAEANPPYLHVIYQYIVPVELTSFTATANDGDIQLSWITATETNNQGFEVQRSNGGEFEAIAFVEGHGTTTEVQAYSYTDRNVTEGSYSYRLKQIDFDGSFEYSNVVEVDVSSPAVYALEQNYPNPFNPSTKIAFRLAVDSKVSLKVFDVLGQEVATLVNTNLVAGAHNVDFNASSLNSGVYFYRIEATGINGTNFVDVKKMILTK